jgi:hypothetical protein
VRGLLKGNEQKVGEATSSRSKRRREKGGTVTAACAGGPAGGRHGRDPVATRRGVPHAREHEPQEK